MDFVAIDFETANAALSSICQIGVVKFQDGKVSDTWQALVNPEDYFDPVNIWIHGIEEEMVRDAPKFPEVFGHMENVLTEQIVAHHTYFDRVALNRVIEKYQLPSIDCTFLDTAKVVRRAWPQFAWKGYGLKNVAKELDIQFKHHVADEDARAAGEILLRAIDETGMNIEDWLVRVNKPIDLASAKRRIKIREGHPEGPLAGEKLVFTGALSMSRREAADVAAAMGCDVDASVTKATTLLVVGEQDIRRLMGHEKSSKHRKAEKLISEGQSIKIIGENDLLKIMQD